MQAVTEADFESRLNALDVSLWSKVFAQISDEEKRSLMAVQKAIRARGPYSYLEIGSYLGGSLQPHLLDPKCQQIYSIDKRPRRVNDDRGYTHTYTENSTAHMLSLLREVAPTDKIKTFESDASDVGVDKIATAPSLCFIDGEHTKEAVLSDFAFCRRVAANPAVICFDDVWTVYTAINEIVVSLTGSTFHAYALPNNLFVIEIGDIPIHQSDDVMRLLIDNHRAYLPGMMFLNGYRNFCNRPSVRAVRSVVRIIRKMTGR